MWTSRFAARASPKGLADAPKTCAATSRENQSLQALETREEALDALDKALAETAPDKRDAKLAGLEAVMDCPSRWLERCAQKWRRSNAVMRSSNRW
ncbi:MAG: hypothetical protein IPK83_24700 [Planctomycetes bacterium]|nr:hypothetical protein [Planctomycetota bacterium]